ncbi:hypothetical protein HBB16_02235 [Pseudonocardia sp. MCCB 268]|nr:hypothetical protein [Pseudonocardia cytotoxica]
MRGDRTMGIWEKARTRSSTRWSAEFGFDPPRAWPRRRRHRPRAARRAARGVRRAGRQLRVRHIRLTGVTEAALRSADLTVPDLHQEAQPQPPRRRAGRADPAPPGAHRGKGHDR